jgi:predicted DNA-binding protein (UPF0251 family)
MNISSLSFVCEMNICAKQGKAMRGPYRKRRVDFPPRFVNFKPQGIPARMLEEMVVTIDEFEAIRLADYLDLEHAEAAARMEISRPTFTRLVDQARKKIARAIIEGKEIIIEGGNVDFVNELYRCDDCGNVEPVPSGSGYGRCNNCGSGNISPFSGGFGKGGHGRGKHKGKY